MNELESRVREQGFACRVEARERLAILIPDGPSAPAIEDRMAIMRLAREAGFTHVALELDPDGAALSRD